jgi:hypothetical protein
MFGAPSQAKREWEVAALNYRLVITRHRAKVFQNLGKGVRRHLHHPGKALINDDARYFRWLARYGTCPTLCAKGSRLRAIDFDFV